jgi:UDP-GlcNAc:undecaprenyl-phosphate/decaprenyl-phosphate GlcNAc-1-phosphate transferase
VFLGDVGSYFAGSWLAMLVVVALVAHVPVEAAIAPMALFVADAGVTLVRRIATGQSWRTAHRDHVYQHLFDTGWSQVAIVGVVVTAAGACSALGWVSLVGSTPARVVADLGVAVILLVYLSLPGLANRRAHGHVARSTHAFDGGEEGA